MAPGSFSDCGGGVGGAVVAWGVFFRECGVCWCLSFCLPLGGAHLVKRRWPGNSGALLGLRCL